MNVQDVVLRVKRTFGDEAGVQISELDIIRWINDAQEEIALTNEGLMETTSSTDTIKGQGVYDFPENLAVLRSLKYKGFRLKSLSFAEFNEYIDGYTSPDSSTNYGTGVPDMFMVWEEKISLFPVPDETVVNGLTLYYMQHPPTVSNMADNLTIPRNYHNSVVNYCLQQAYELDEDYQKAGIKKGQFDETMMKLNDRNKWTSQEYYPSITTLPQDENFGGFGYLGGLP